MKTTTGLTSSPVVRLLLLNLGVTQGKKPEILFLHRQTKLEGQISAVPKINRTRY